VARPLGALPVLMRHSMIKPRGVKPCKSKARVNKARGASCNNNKSSRDYINKRIKKNNINKNKRKFIL
jgi:hypothetical protein